MTKQHPLTDEMCKEIQLHIFNQTDEDDMRAAYDLGESKGAADMLEQVIEWLKDELDNDPNCMHRYLLFDLKAAMRPQQQEDN